MTQVIWAGPYVVKWRGAELPLNDVRISAVPFNRIWTGRQRPLDQTRMARYVTFDMPKAGSLVVALPEKADGVEVFPLSLRARVTATRRTCGPNQTIRNVVFDDLPHVEETAVEFGK